jgi:hypothetical protein
VLFYGFRKKTPGVFYDSAMKRLFSFWPVLAIVFLAALAGVVAQTLPPGVQKMQSMGASPSTTTPTD